MKCSTFFVSFCQLLLISLCEGRIRMNSCRGVKGARCVNIWECSFFVKLRDTNPRPPSFIIQVRDGFCGFVDADRRTPKVCCPDSYPNETAENGIKAHKHYHLLPTDCGPISHGTRITEGLSAHPGEFPWMALIAYRTGDSPEDEDFKCGGTLINDRYVMTAAHCLEDNTVLGVRLGEHDIETERDCEHGCQPPVQDLLINKIIVHPRYNPATYANDIALIKLATPANLTHDNVKPVCLPQDDAINLVGKFLTVAGWGVTETGHKSLVLNKASIPVKPIRDCIKLYGKYKPITRYQICAGGYQGRDSCAGDSGGPLQHIVDVRGSHRYVQEGIVSYGPSQCGIEGRPAIYTNVKEYMTWILNNIEPQ